MVVTPSMRTRRLIKSLSKSQCNDEYLSASSTQLIRYTLLYSFGRCVQVFVKPGDSTLPRVDRVVYCRLPSFLRSQLEAQRITDTDTDIIWEQVEPLLHFIHNHLRSSRWNLGYPTLFRWYSPERHRSYFFFAFTDFKMISKVYTPGELLKLRFAPFKVSLLKKLNDKVEKNPDLRDIIRMPTRALNLIAEEDKDSLAMMTGHSVAPVPASRPDAHAPGPATAPAAGPSTGSAPQLDGTVSEWKYRGRTDSENTDVHPVCAPAGPVAQKDEGFQKFYKAVASPTHVRVTAGGRIVPNTRGSSSPAGKWTKDRTTSETGSSTRPQSRNQSEQSMYPVPPQGNFSGFAPMVSGYTHGMAPRMVAGPQMPMIPMPMGINMGGAYSMPPPIFRHPQADQPVPSQSAQVNEKKDDGAGSGQGKPPVQISPPEHFDRSKPFFYNGQWVMPHAQQYYPFGPMAGHPFPVPQMNGQMMGPYGAMYHPAAMPGFVQPVQPVQPVQSAQPAQPVQPIQPVQPVQPVQSTQLQRAQPQPGQSQPAQPAVPNPVEAPISSIRISEVTKKQLDFLRMNLRFFEDQLLYNKHQIDEKAVTRQAADLRQTMLRFQKNFEEQIASETGRYPKVEKTKKQTQSTSTTPDSCVQSKDSKTPVTSDGDSDLPGSKGVVQKNEQTKPPTVRGKSTKARTPYRPVSGVSQGNMIAGPEAPNNLVGNPRGDVEKVRKVSTLPTSAALAPPFQPRSAMAGYRVSADGDRMASGIGATRTSEQGQIRHAPRVGAGVSGSSSDFAYNRELTPDELQARLMYWGKSLQYPQGALSNLNESFMTPMQQSCSAARRTTATQSETLAGPGQSALSMGEEIVRPDSCLTQVSPNYEGLREEIEAKMMALSDSSPETPLPIGFPLKKPSPSGDSDSDLDGKTLIFRGRQGMSSKNKPKDPVWQSMMKSKPSAHAAPGKVSPMTAQGVLPNYAGHATASLSPAIANTAQARNPAMKLSPGDPNGNRSVTLGADKRGENRHPANYLAGGVSLRGSDFSSN